METTGRKNKDSAKHELNWNVCRECHTVQHCVLARGWHLCRTCLETIDRQFTAERADANFDGWILTRTGKRFNAFQPVAELVDAEDIAFALGNLCRFTGHCRFYSVAQHSIITALIIEHDLPVPVSPMLTLGALLHDAHEAFLNDLASPIKRHLPRYVSLCDNVQRVIEQRFNVILSADERAIINRADLIALASEAKVLAPNTDGWNLKEVPSKRALEALNAAILQPTEAQDLFRMMLDSTLERVANEH